MSHKRSSITVQEDPPEPANVFVPSSGGGMSKSVSQLSFNTAFQSKFSSFPATPKSCTVQGEIQIKYSGELAYERGYYRECVGKIAFKIQPSLVFGFFDIIPFPRCVFLIESLAYYVIMFVYCRNPRMCSFCFSVYNLSKVTLTLTCSMKQSKWI